MTKSGFAAKAGPDGSANPPESNAEAHGLFAHFGVTLIRREAKRTSLTPTRPQSPAGALISMSYLLGQLDQDASPWLKSQCLQRPPLP